MLVMKKGLQTQFWQDRLRTSLIVLNLCVLQLGCSGSSAPPDSTQNPVAIAPEQSSVDRIPTVLLQLQDDPGLIADIPDIVNSVTLANTGLQVAYTRAGQEADAPALAIEGQWVHMQTCLEQTAVPPIVVVREDAVIPFTANDDVIYGIEGIPNASSSKQDVPLIQVLATDFDGSLGNAGFNLRSIMGRLLWVSAGLAERDYPFQCARQQIDIGL